MSLRRGHDNDGNLEEVCDSSCRTESISPLFAPRTLILYFTSPIKAYFALLNTMSLRKKTIFPSFSTGKVILYIPKHDERFDFIKVSQYAMPPISSPFILIS